MDSKLELSGFGILIAYEFRQPDRYGEECPDVFEELFDEFTDTLSLSEQLKSIPSYYFVFSEELIKAFSDFIDYTIDREDASDFGMSLNWSPSYQGCGNLINECPDFSHIEILERNRGPGRPKKDNRDVIICARLKELMKRMSVKDASTELSKKPYDGEYLSPRSIANLHSRKCKKLAQ